MVNQQGINMKKEYKRYNNIKNDKTIVQKSTIMSSEGLAIFYKNKNNILDVEFVNAIAVACKGVFSEITHFDEIFETKIFCKEK